MECLLQIVAGTSLAITVEPIDRDESRGVEFKLARTAGETEFWSVKRQTSRSEGWSLAQLASKDARGRSILEDLLFHIEQSPVFLGVFASQQGTRDIVELQNYAVTNELLSERLKLNPRLNDGFRKVILPLAGGNFDRAVAFLQRTRFHAADEQFLRNGLDLQIGLRFYLDQEIPIDPVVIRGLLAEFILDHLGRPIQREDILKALAQHGVRLRDWSQEMTVLQRLNALLLEYTDDLKSQRINKAFIHLPAIEAILSSDLGLAAPQVLVVGEAGSGKSTILSEIAQRLDSSGIPVLGIRMDSLDPAIQSTKELGRKLQLPASPAVVLAGIAHGGPAVLIIDQLDAVSLTSGRRNELWSLFQALLSEADRYPGLCLLIGCRAFDLEHDHRMRALAATPGKMKVVEVHPLSQEQVDSALRTALVEPATLSPALRSILALPLHLAMFLQLKREGVAPVRNREDLFEHYWVQAEQRVSLRVGHRIAWNRLIDALVSWLSDHQQLSAPLHVLDDDYPAEGPALASENILVCSSGQYRFFHEAFFDYAFAIRFNTTGRKLIDFLLQGEQHLFQRAQVRQVLTYLRSKDARKYQEELEGLLISERVRFHIKRLILRWLSSLSDPSIDEWRLLLRFETVFPGLHSHVRNVTWGSIAWFDILDEVGFLDSSLSGGSLEAQQECIALFTHPAMSEHRSMRIAELLLKHRQATALWDQYLRNICNSGSVYRSPEMFELFLSLIDDGTLDDLRPGFAVNDDWWSVLYSMAQSRPDLASVAIGHWFDRVVAKCREMAANIPGEEAEPDDFAKRLREGLDRSMGGSGTGVVLGSAKSFVAFSENILPRLVGVVDQISKECPDHLDIDPIWGWRSYGSQPHAISGALIEGLALALEALAAADPCGMDRLLVPFLDRPQNTVAYLVLRAWTAAPPEFADRLADFLLANPLRLKVGYSSWGGGGYAANLRSVMAVKMVSTNASKSNVLMLEETILALTDHFEARHPKWRGGRELELLEAIGESRLSAAGRARWQELRRKFPNEDLQPPQPTEAIWVGSPISKEAQSRMSDAQWLKALQKYAGIDHHPTRRGIGGGGERQLAAALEEQTKENPSRFVALTERMPKDIPISYLEAILNGASASEPERYLGASEPAKVDQISGLIRRIHSLPNRPCGKTVAWVIVKLGDPGWPDDILEILISYALNDPDPKPDEGAWLDPADQAIQRGDIQETGMNTTRGAAAEALARILFDRPARAGMLLDAVHHLVLDPSLSVRACAIEALVALLNVDIPLAIRWFFDCVSDPRLYGTHYAERFVHYAGYRDFLAIRPALLAMATSEETSTVKSASRQICILALDHDEAFQDAAWIHSGNAAMRHSAADVYATNIANETVGPRCQSLLKPFFSDPDDSVRKKAASAFQHLANLPRNEQSDLLQAFLASDPTREALRPVLDALEKLPIQLPEEICTLTERCITAFKGDAGDYRTAHAGASMDLSKLIIRLYSQTETLDIQRRCLNLIDEMELHHFLGLDEELRTLDR